MKILWREKRPVTFAEIRTELQNDMKWEKSTINTLIRRLTDKGVIYASRREVLYYAPNVSYSEYSRSEEQSFIDRLYDGSAKRFAAALCQSGKLSEADIDELKEYFRMGGQSK